MDRLMRGCPGCLPKPMAAQQPGRAIRYYAGSRGTHKGIAPTAHIPLLSLTRINATGWVLKDLMESWLACFTAGAAADFSVQDRTRGLPKGGSS